MAKGSSADCGNFNLKGKKSMTLGCGCCTATNIKDEVLEKEHNKEMKQYEE